MPAECAVECQGDQRDEHQIARYGSAALSRHSSSGRARCRPGIFARWPAIGFGALHTKGGGPLVSAATIAGENPLSISVSGEHGVLTVCESSGCVHCQLARLAISFARAIIRSRHGDGNVLACCAHSFASVHC